MATLTTLSGFPEWLPEDKLVEGLCLDSIRKNFELYGFTPLETRAVEPLEQLLVKGETDKEIYLLRRLQADESEPDMELGLHFDLTVPFARYVSENHGRLVFPFRRYQLQKAWRGERPGLGRFREFLQADIDIISDQQLSIQSDIEIVTVLVDILYALPIPQVQVMINNRKILEGFYKALGIADHLPVMRIVDKLAKMAKDEGVMLAISSDAHRTQDFDNLIYGIGQARRGWLEARDVLNTRPLAQLRPLLRRPSRSHAKTAGSKTGRPAPVTSMD